MSRVDERRRRVEPKRGQAEERTENGPDSNVLLNSAEPAAASEEPAGVGRRGFLQLGLMGGAAATLGVGSVEGQQSGKCPKPPADDPVIHEACEGGAVPGGKQFPYATNPVDLATDTETWIEPWIWRPSDWPGQDLTLNVVENENPGPVVGFGNDNGVIFSYGGITPGPTIRMRGDEILSVKLRNLLGEDLGTTAVGPAPDLASLPPKLAAEVKQAQAEGGTGYEPLGADLREDFCLGEHTNGLHSAHVTNLHTHGLHVRPGRNPDGTHSDNVILRVIPQKDLLRRERLATTTACEWLRDPEQTTFLRDDEQAGQADYEFRLGNVAGTPVHPPGTFWYHPHSHGATHNQVASGMAGFLIVEGDVDEAINRRMTNSPEIDPELKTGEWDYRERLMLMQRVLVAPKDTDAPQETLRSPNNPAINGNAKPDLITMRPGAIERWRVLNGSVDGRGYRRFMVLAGQYAVSRENLLIKYDPAKECWSPADGTQVEKDKQQLFQLAMDGITLMDVQPDGTAKYTIRDLAQQNAGTVSPLDGPLPDDCPPEWARSTNGRALCRYNEVWKNGSNLRNAYLRPNEVYLAPANRCDVFFQAPRAEDQVYTVLAHKVVLHADNPIQKLQQNVAKGCSAPPPGPEQIVMAYVGVSSKTKGVPREKRGHACPTFDVLDLIGDLPEVPDYLQPVTDADLKAPNGTYRTRTIEYSGWGSQDFPLIEVPQEFVDRNPQLRNLVYAEHGGSHVLLPAAIRTMAIDGRKFDPTDPERPRMGLDTAEEWALYNSSTMLWGDVDAASQPPTQFQGHYVSYPITRAEGNRRFREDANFQVVTKGVDHPFHIHQNPFWVTRVEVPDENGVLHNILPYPRWQDVVWIPRHTGRVVFRSRFPDYVGTFVEHCHLLLHEDNGMMQVLEITPFEDQVNCVKRNEVTSPGMSAEEVSEIYERPTLAQAYKKSISFVDPNHSTGQVYPGFDVEPPQLVDDD